MRQSPSKAPERVWNNVPFDGYLIAGGNKTIPIYYKNIVINNTSDNTLRVD
ncbi:hypothetical protein SAMN05444487_103134 [Marininema mesophilum]|uniref:Uncharacterized protein n=1 Tax=Marininema mesophilum TaxID=1048340 RepID=A0A1H2THS4_9BACL|nr:hypothetical protein SAMN05444487_103134 [Marininema mesophilum]